MILSNRLMRLAIAGLVAVWVAIWGLGLAASNARADDDPPQFHGTMGQFTLIKPLRPAPEIPLKAENGEGVVLSRYRGKVVLLNFWATWCGPCVREMPALQSLQEKLKADGFVIVAASIDRTGFAKITPFLERIGVTKLTILLDRKRTLYRKFGVRGLPTTMLIDTKGKVRGYLEGPAEWDTPEAEALIRYYLKASGGVKKAEAKR